jgi:alpha-mannosidase
MQGACVQNVLDSIVPALLADKNRKFIYVEQVCRYFLLLCF